MKRIRKRKTFPGHDVGTGDVYADLGINDPEGMLVKAQLVAKIAEIVGEQGYTQTRAADILGVPQPKLSKILRGQFLGVSERRLMDCLAKLGRNVDIVVHRASGHRRKVARQFARVQPVAEGYGADTGALPINRLRRRRCSMNWYREALRKYATFEGRARRKEYWFFTLGNFLAVVVLTVVDMAVGTFNEHAEIGLFGGVYLLAVLDSHPGGSRFGPNPKGVIGEGTPMPIVERP